MVSPSSLERARHIWQAWDGKEKSFVILVTKEIQAAVVRELYEAADESKFGEILRERARNIQKESCVT